MLAGALAFGALPAFSAGPPSGFYRISVTMGSPDLVMQEVYASEECLTPDDFVVGPRHYVDRHPEEARSCLVDEYVLGGGAVRMRLRCTFGQTSAAIRGAGTYDAHGFDVDNDVTLGMHGLSLDVKAKLVGKRLGGCPAAP